MRSVRTARARHRVVVAGGGFAGLQAVRKLARAPVDVTLIDRRNEVFKGGGNPYGASYTRDHRVEGPGETTLMVARAQGARLARVAGVIGAAREAAS
jgi:ribulose 1,5-bisphosphate synthetase/thiazole synthase